MLLHYNLDLPKLGYNLLLVLFHVSLLTKMLTKEMPLSTKWKLIFRKFFL